MIDVLQVSCPVCAARKGKVCVYIWPKNGDGSPMVRYAGRSADVLAKMDRAGTPVQRPHGGRSSKAGVAERLRLAKQRDAEYAASNAASPDRAAALRANAQAVTDEQYQLAAWLRAYAHVLTGAN